MTTSSRLSSLALVALSIAAVGCAKDPGNGSVTISYDWNLGSACDTPFGASATQTVEQIRVTLTNGDTEKTATETCDDEEIKIDGVQEGNYTVLVEGLDATGDTIADNITIPADEDESVGVSEGNTSSVEADLEPTPATIEVALLVNNADGFPVMCAAAPVKLFEVKAVGEGFGTLHEETLDFCTHTPGFLPVPDMNRDIKGLLLNRVDIEFQDPMGNSVGDETYDLGAPIGAGKTVEIRVECMDTDCAGTVTFPEGGGGGDGDPTGGMDDGMATTGGGGSDSGGADSTGGGSGTGGADGTTGG